MLASIDDERAITSLIHRYATGIDTKDFDLFRTCWAERIECDYGAGPDWVFSTPDEITDLMERFHENMPHTLHYMTNIVLDDVGPDTVKGRTYVRALLMGEQNVPLTDVYGYYDDTFGRLAGEWKFTGRNFNLVRVVDHS